MITFTPEQKRRRNKLARKLQQRDPARPYTACIREAVQIVQGRKRAPKKRPARGVSEAGRRQAVTEAAVDRAIKKALARPARPVRELDEADLGVAFGRVIREGMQSPFWVTEAAPPGQAPAPAAAPSADGKPLHQLDLQTGDAVMGASADGYAQAYGLVSPFWR